MVGSGERDEPGVETQPASDQSPLVEDDVAPAKSTKSPAFQFYPESWLSSSRVRRMSYTERGIYMDLLSHAWLDLGLVDDLRQIAALVGIPAKRFERLWNGGPLHECWHERNGRLYNKRQEVERKKQAEFRAKQAANGALGGRGNKKATALSGSTQKQTKESSLVSLSDPISVSYKRERGATLVQPRRGYAAWEGPKGLYVPEKKHADFVALRNHPNANKELFDWYGEVADKWQGSPGADMLKFWTDRFNEKWPSAEPAKKPFGNWRPVEAK